MTGRRFHDFDAAFAEQDAEPIRFKLLGREWECPPEQPASVTLKAMRAGAIFREFRRRCDAAGLKPGDKLPEGFQYPDGWGELDDLSSLSCAGEIVGQDNLDAWLALGIGTEVLREVVEWVAATQRGEDDEDDPEGEDGDPKGEAGPPKTGAKRTRSSSGGQRSKRTSAGSTASGSAKKSRA